MASVFIRKYSLTIGRNTELIKQLKPAPYGPYPQIVDDTTYIDVLTDYSYHKYSPVQKNAYWDVITSGELSVAKYVDITVIPPKAITINSEYQLEASIPDSSNTTTTGTQQATIKLYNIPSNMKDFMRVGDAVILNAGWEKDGDELPRLFVGQIDTVFTKKEHPNTITAITAKPAKLLEDININRSYPPATTVGAVLTDLLNIAASKGLPTGDFFKNPSDYSVLEREFAFGLNVHGTLLNALSEVAENSDYVCNVVKGKLYLQPKYNPPFKKKITITESNLKSSIEQEKSGAGAVNTAQGSATPSVIKFTVLLNANIDTTTIVEVKVEGYQGYYNVVSVRHDLNFEGGEWESEISATRIQ